MDEKKAYFVSVLICAVLIAVILGGIGWYRWDYRENRGYTFGYNGDLNRVRNTLASIPGVRITKAWANRDISLEEFGFTIIRNGQEILINVDEKDQIRSFSGGDLLRELENRITRFASTTNF